jgi:hypothetical protein
LETKIKLSLLVLLLVGGLASAQTYEIDNSTMTPAYKEVFYNNPIRGVLLAYTTIWGPWFYLLIILGPYFMMYVYHGNKLGIASIWLLTTLAAYEYLIAGLQQDVIFYFVIVAWVVSIIMKVVSPYRPEGV